MSGQERNNNSGDLYAFQLDCICLSTQNEIANFYQI